VQYPDNSVVKQGNLAKNLNQITKKEWKTRFH